MEGQDPEAQSGGDDAESPNVLPSSEASSKVVSSPSQMATVQIGSLGKHSVQDLAEHLPNIGIYFTCKVCNVTCTQVRSHSD